MKAKQVFIILLFLIGVVYVITKNKENNVPYLSESISNDVIKFQNIFDFNKDSIYLGNELNIVETDKNGSITIRLNKVLLKDSINQIYFFTKTKSGKKNIYKINENFEYEKVNLSSIEKLASLYYIEFDFNDLDYIKRNGKQFLNPSSLKPEINLIEKEPYFRYFRRNISKIICFNLNSNKCTPSPRKAEYQITIPLKKQKIKLKSKGTVDYCYLKVYYLNRLNDDSFVFLSNGGKDLWVARIR